MSDPRSGVGDHRVLVAGPDDLLRRNLVLFLQREGLDVVSVQSGREAIFLAQQIKPSVVILENGLADVPALGICQCFREMPSLSGIPCILITADPTAEFEALARSAGAYGVLTMPLDARDIVVKVANALLLMPTPGDATTVVLEGGGAFNTVVSEARVGRQVVLETPATAADLLAGHPEGVAASFNFVDAAYTKTTWKGVLLGHSHAGIEVRLTRITERSVRRAAYRKPIDMPVRYKFTDDAYRWGRLVDLSVSGFKMASTGAEPRVGAMAELSFTLGQGGRPLRVAGVARWARRMEEDTFHCGMAFYKLPEELRDHLVAYLFEGVAAAGQIAV